MALPIHIKPAPRLTHKPAALMNARRRSTADSIAGNKLYLGMVCIKLTR